VASSYGALDVETAGADVGIEVEHAPARLVDAPVDLAAVRGPPEQIDADVGSVDQIGRASCRERV